jgi:ATP/maltotriose-dependent transcriptional regulator MalT
LAKASTRSEGRAVHSAVERARECFEQRSWADAFDLFLSADQSTSLEGDDLERLATSASLLGRDKEFAAAMDRAYHSHLKCGKAARAARAALWRGFRLLAVGERGAAAGWLARANKLVEEEAQECVEKGYLLLPLAQMRLSDGDPHAAYKAASEAAKFGERFREPDLIAFARNLQARALIFQGRIREGMALLDEAMVAVSSRELSPIVTGVIYCTAIASCHRVYAFGRAREWTSALASWCDEQSQLVSFTGRCLVHRAELMQLNGDWPDAIEEARRASKREAVRTDPHAAGDALYQEGEVHRLRGDYAAAGQAYRSASEMGIDPQPGLALLRAAQGHTDAAAAAIRRALAGPKDPLQRTRLLPACVDIMLRAGEIEEAREAANELKDIAARYESDVLGAMAKEAEASIALKEGNPQAALGLLRGALRVWRQSGAPYVAACLRVLIGMACRSLGDEDGAKLEWSAAKTVFEGLGAAPDVGRIDALERSAGSPHGLTQRELQVLGLVADGKTNKLIARQLGLSEKTIDRHVSNIFAKLDVSSRAAATAEAFKRRLI